MKLVIFDLDQTLVDFIPVHNGVTRRLFKRFFGVDARLTEIDFAGKNLNDIFRELAVLKNVPEDIFREKKAGLLASYGDAFAESLPADAGKYVLPGVRELLDELSVKGHVIALYTGNSRRIADAVLEATGLGGYFRFCLYGTETEIRSDMVRLAIEKAGKLAAREFRGRDVVIIGDSVRDIESGRPFGALTIAVATGFHSREKLMAAGPDYLFANLENHREVLKAIETP
ncbi:MAG: HAD family hydrolase [Dehalococcoidia bacterium]|nr:MAG: HAD family hydrolase [Dehalococcoidia bacterium]